jgi:hypothetical protein
VPKRARVEREVVDVEAEFEDAKMKMEPLLLVAESVAGPKWPMEVTVRIASMENQSAFRHKFKSMFNIVGFPSAGCYQISVDDVNALLRKQDALLALYGQPAVVGFFEPTDMEAMTTGNHFHDHVF